MPRGQSCHCPICSVEQTLVLNLNEARSGDWFEVLKTKFPVLANFASVLDLLEHLHSQVHEHALAPADKILSALIQGDLGNAEPGVSQGVLLLVFMPTIHKTFCEVCVRFSNLSPQDISQQVLTAFLDLARSPGIKRRNGHLSAALARGVRKAVFRWAISEARNSPDPWEANGSQEPPEHAAEGNAENLVLLEELFSDCRRTGLLSESEFELLIKMKLEGFEAKELALAANLSATAIRSRLQRIMSHLRRTAWK